jgi:hypothetical protein
MRTTRFLLGAVVAAVVGLGVAAPAHAAELALSESHQRVLAREFERQSCAEGTAQTDPRMAGRGVHQDGWHFRAAGGDFVRLTVTFAPDGADPAGAGDHQIVVGEVGDPASPVAFHAAGPFIPDAYVFLPAGWLLVTATAEVGRGTRLVLQATCAGEPDQPAEPTPSAEPTPTPPAGSPIPTPSAGVPDPGPTGGTAAPTVPAGATPPAATATVPPEAEEPPPPDEDLPGLAFTGAQVGGMVVLGTGLLSAGVAMLAVRRRRTFPDLIDDRP